MFFFFCPALHSGETDHSLGIQPQGSWPWSSQPHLRPASGSTHIAHELCGLPHESKRYQWILLYAAKCAATVGRRSGDKNLNQRPSRRSSINLRNHSMAGLRSVTFWFSWLLIWFENASAICQRSTSDMPYPTPCVTVPGTLTRSQSRHLPSKQRRRHLSSSSPSLSPGICRASQAMPCDRCLSGTMRLSVCAYTRTRPRYVRLIEMDAFCIWAFRESECMWQIVNQPVMRGNHTADRSISYFLWRQTEEKYYCSPGKSFAF